MIERSETISFENERGIRLAARLDRPAQKPLAFALFAHCFTCSKDFPASHRIARRLVASGFAVMRFDFTGLGQSEGSLGEAGFAAETADVLAAANWLRSHHEAPALLVGHSLGGSAVLAVAAKIPEARAVATIGAPSDPAHLMRLFAMVGPELEARGEADVEIAGRRFTLRKTFFDALEYPPFARNVAAFQGGVLILHAPNDLVVPIDHATRLFKMARHPKSFIALADADHLLSRRADAEYAADVIATWASRYVEPEGAQPVITMQRDREEQPVPDREIAEVRVEEDKVRHAQRITIGPHVLRADEPPHLGGHDTGPMPLELLLAALGACSTITVRMYADRKGWALEHVALKCRLRRGKPGEPGFGPSGHRIERTLEVRGALDTAQRSRLREIADRCPVHRMLSNGVPIETELAPATGDVANKTPSEPGR